MGIVLQGEEKMKKIVSFVIASCFLISYAFALSSCGNSVSGTYMASLLGADVVYEFGSFGSVVIRIYNADDETVIRGKYELSEDGSKITIALESANDDEDETSQYAGTFDFEQGEDDDGKKYVKIGHVTYVEYNKQVR